MGDVTRILEAVGRGEPDAPECLMRAVYEELHSLAAQKLSRERPGHTLQATALVHEAYLRLLGHRNADWQNRRHFFGAAAEAMRRILIERARRKRRQRHGGGLKQVPLDGVDVIQPPESTDLLALDDALRRFAAEDPVKAELVKLRYFAGVPLEQAAEMLELSRATAYRYWTYAKAWLFNEIHGGPGAGAVHEG
ncbi:MAG: sigma-70 family RNA polymerase sigma factor [Phycisphaerae bacterium]|jgi:RNA polymerase sigma factor (TIGR02999 family)